MSDRFDHLLNAPPVDTTYVLGRWHKDRLRPQSYLTEAKVAVRALISQSAGSDKKFLIVSRARSGTTLLRDLLNSHPDINCEGEILAMGRLFPRMYLENRDRKNRHPVYGAKVLSYQMIQIHRIADPMRFFGELGNKGFKFIHLTRNTFWQTFSLLKAGTSGVFHSSAAKSMDLKGLGKADTSAIELNIPDFVARLQWSEALLDYEISGLKDIPHLSLDYDNDLAQPELLQASAKTVFEYIGVSNAPVETKLKKLLPSSAKELILNYDALVAELERMELSHLLPT